LDELEELDVADEPSVLGADVVADDSEELFAGGAGAGVGEVVVVVVDSDRVVVESLVLGDAEGTTRSRSVTRSLLSVQPAKTPTPRARTQTPVSHFFIVDTSVVDSNPARRAAMGVPVTGGLRYAGRLAKPGHIWKENSQ
jgi:hypothetical protein